MTTIFLTSLLWPCMAGMNSVAELRLMKNVIRKIKLSYGDFLLTSFF